MKPHPYAEACRQKADAICNEFPEQARLYEAFADGLDAFERQRWLELLTVEDAASESGFSRDTIYRQVETGRLTNHGKKGAPRIRRGDLPRRKRRGSE